MPEVEGPHMSFGTGESQEFRDNRSCPTCHVVVPPRTGRFCPACGAPMEREQGEHAPQQRAARLASPSFDEGLAEGPFGQAPGRQVATDGPFAAHAVGGLQAQRALGRGDLPGLTQPSVVMPLALAATGALIGALVWAFTMYATGYEIGWVAWAVGGVVGAAAVIGGARGQLHACLAAGLALAGMLGGKVYGANMIVERENTKV
jgi:hypothetical protein